MQGCMETAHVSWIMQCMLQHERPKVGKLWGCMGFLYSPVKLSYNVTTTKTIKAFSLDLNYSTVSREPKKGRNYRVTSSSK